MNNNFAEIIDLLIDQKERDLQRYSLRGDANQRITDKLSTELNLLIELNNKAVDLTVGLPIEKLLEISIKVHHMNELDPELDGHAIYLHRKNGPNLSQNHLEV